ncbi:MAG TPA: hypothetical protein VLG10_03895 [Methylomirabilota bacterium]|nr:hypothetical protein [Methylomirabilota bacterium]
MRVGLQAVILALGLSLAVPAPDAVTRFAQATLNGECTGLPSLDIGGQDEALDGTLLTGNAFFDATGVSTSQVNLTIEVTNTTDTWVGESIALFGFNADRSVAASFASGGAGTVFDRLADDTNSPSFRRSSGS